MFKHILLPLDGSQLAEAAIPYAAELCRKLDSQITLLHVIEKDAPSEIHGQRHLTSEDESTKYLDQIAKKSFSFCSKVNMHVHTEEVSQVAASIVDHSAEIKPDLIILTAHGAGGWRDIVVGSIAQQVIASGREAVLLIKPSESSRKKQDLFGKILLPLDGEPDHELSLKVATELAKRLDAKLHMIRVVPTLSTLSGTRAAVGTLLPVTTGAVLEITEDEACQYLQKILDKSVKDGIDGSAEVQRGEIVQEIIEAAERDHADLIVLGTHGKAGLGAFWAGSTAPKIVAKAQMPLLLVPVRRD
jgi:nucleotide-binding universal stress UspA family protein